MLSALSGCLGENKKPSLWLWNLVPTQALMPGNDVPKKSSSIPWYVGFAFLRCPGKSRRALVRERDSNLKLTRVVQSRDIKFRAMLPILSPRPNSHLGILVPHSGSIPGLRSRPNLDLGTLLGLGTSVPYINPPWFVPGCRVESRNWPSIFILRANQSGIHAVTTSH